MRRILDELKDFALKGSLVEIAVGLVLALAFTALINALVEHVIMPIIAIPFGQPSFDDLVLTINDSVIRYGAFLTAVVQFLLVALGLFLLVVKPYNTFKARLEARRAAGEEEPAPEPDDIALLREIRDELRQRS